MRSTLEIHASAKIECHDTTLMNRLSPKISQWGYLHSTIYDDTPTGTEVVVSLLPDCSDEHLALYLRKEKEEDSSGSGTGTGTRTKTIVLLDVFMYGLLKFFFEREVE